MPDLPRAGPSLQPYRMSANLRLALCTDGVFPHAMGGMQRHSRLLAEHLVRSGEVELTVLHPHPVGIFIKDLGIREVHVPPIDTEKFYLRELWRYSKRIGEALDEVAPDVVLSQGFCVWQGIDRFSTKLIMHPHGLEMFQGLTRKERVLGTPFRMALRHMVRRSHTVVSLGGKLTGILQDLAAGSRCEVVVIPNAVDVPESPNSVTGHVPGPLVLLFVGRFAFNKGIDVLLDVARRLVAEGKGNEVRFDLAGTGPVYQQVKEEGVPPNVRLLGRVDDDELASLYSACDAVILPTRFEGMPTVVLEAMARAKPIFVSDVGATAEQVDGRNGYLLPPGDAEALYRAIAAFCALSPQSRSSMGLKSFERVTELFSWPAATARFLRLFSEVAKSAPR